MSFIFSGLHLNCNESSSYCKSKNRKRERVNRPLITFGVTVNGEKYDTLLYLMDFFSIKDCIDDFITNYLDKFPISLEAYCKWIDVQMKEDEKG